MFSDKSRTSPDSCKNSINYYFLPYTYCKPPHILWISITWFHSDVIWVVFLLVYRGSGRWSDSPNITQPTGTELELNPGLVESREVWLPSLCNTGIQHGEFPRGDLRSDPAIYLLWRWEKTQIGERTCQSHLVAEQGLEPRPPHSQSEIKNDGSWTSPVGPWLRLCLPAQEVWVRSLVEELRSYMWWSVVWHLKKKKIAASLQSQLLTAGVAATIKRPGPAHSPVIPGAFGFSA